MFKFHILSLFLVLGTTLSFGSTPPNVKNESADSKALPPRLIEIVQSNEYIDIASESGKPLLLPKYNMVLVDGDSSINSLEDHLRFSDDLELKDLRDELALHKEMEDLSSKLGVEIRESDNLDLYRAIVDWLGTRYRMGGMNRNAVDCSGFTNIIYNTVYNKKIPRVSTAIAKKVTESLPIEKLLPGDLVFFATRGRKRINHVGVYLGDGRFAHASIKGGVKVSPLTEGYYKRALRKAGRID